MTPSATATLRQIRRLLLLLLIVGLLGTATDLVALGHYEDAWQFAPLIVVGAAIAIVGWHIAGGGVASVLALRIVMVISLVTGVVGFVLHYQSNLEFQVEIDATLGGWALFWKVIQSHAPPALAPMAMGLLGLLGLVYTVGHQERPHD